MNGSEPVQPPAQPESRQERRAREREARKKAKKVASELRNQQIEQGLKPPSTTTIANTVSQWKTIEEEIEGRQGAVDAQIKTYRQLLPTLLRRLEKIPDPRNPKTIKHKLVGLLLYGMLAFVYQMSSRREANREMTKPQFKANLRLLFPELESLPHQDTLNRVLARIDVNQLEQAHVDLIKHCMKKKKFLRYLVNNLYTVAMDGTQKLVVGNPENEELLEREHTKKEPDGSTSTTKEYYAYVLEADLVLAEGLTIPLLSEFLSYSESSEVDQDKMKQDCEQRAFPRLAKRLKNLFRRLPLMLVLDGLYATGPTIELCRKYGWQFMIVLKDGSLPSVWVEVRCLMKLHRENHLKCQEGIRRQRFTWFNDIDYQFGANGRKQQTLHVAICEESWEEVDSKTAEVKTITSRHAWVSSERIDRSSIRERCQLQARRRWGIESSFLIEKWHGYNYEHDFSLNWNAMKGYHYLMRLAYLFNVLAQRTAVLASLIKREGLCGLFDILRSSCSGPWLNSERINKVLARPGQFRLE